MEEPEDWRLGTILRPISAFQLYSCCGSVVVVLAVLVVGVGMGRVGEVESSVRGSG